MDWFNNELAIYGTVYSDSQIFCTQVVFLEQLFTLGIIAFLLLLWASAHWANIQLINFLGTSKIYINYRQNL